MSVVELSLTLTSRTVTALGATPRTPVNNRRNFVCAVTIMPDESVQVVVTVNGSGVPVARSGLVTFVTTARPSGPFDEVKMSGCTVVICIKLRTVRTPPVSRMLMTTGTVFVPVVAVRPFGTRKSISVGLTKKRPAEAFAIESETPPSSNGSDGARCDSDAASQFGPEGVQSTICDDAENVTLPDCAVVFTTAIMPGASPVSGVAVGVGLGVGVGVAGGVATSPALPPGEKAYGAAAAGLGLP